MDSKFPLRNSHSGKTLGVFTSGGDACGMNGALRACVRTAIFLGCQPYLINEGYQGMVDGGDNFVKADWATVSSIIHRGGTVIGSARCEAFRERDGRLKAATNLVKKGINRLVVIGGDGSLTGANLFRQEWSSLLADLVKTNKITCDQLRNFADLHIVGLVGSIDNDFCGTDLTIGVDTALQRITSAIDAITSTAQSHQRTFVMEIMGRHCGYLSLIAGLTAEADYVFIPESPPPYDWPDQLCEKLKEEKAAGARMSIIIVAEGAIDRDCNPITAEMVKEVVVTRLKSDTRVIVLGHVQRGGSPSAMDRILGCRMAAEATRVVLEADATSIPVVIGIEGVNITRQPLMESVEMTKGVGRAMEEKQWERAVEMRGNFFAKTFCIVNKLTRILPKTICKPNCEPAYRLAVMHVGSSACGMNAAVHSFVRNAISRGDEVWSISNGFDGLVEGLFKKMDFCDVNDWVSQGGAFLGITRTPVDGKYEEVSARFKQFKIDGLLIIGGFEAYRSMLLLLKQRPNYPEFCIPMIVIPSTPSNSIPGTDYTLGCDTSLNNIVEICDRIRISSRGMGKRVFVIETMGAYCGYLTTMAAIAGGADTAYIFEEKFNVCNLKVDVRNMIAKMSDGVERGLILVNENASENYNSDFVYRIFNEEGTPHYRCFLNLLGNLQEGGTPTPFDRALGVMMGSKVVDWFSYQFKKNMEQNRTIKTMALDSVCLLSYSNCRLTATPLLCLVSQTDFTHRIWRDHWYLSIRPLLRILSIHSSGYDEEAKRLQEFYAGEPVQC